MSMNKIVNSAVERVVVDSLTFCKERPSWSFSVGDSVMVGALRNCVVVGIHADGRVYEIEHDSRDRKSSDRERTYFAFYEVRPFPKDDVEIVRNDDVMFSFSNQSVESQICRVLRFGVDFNPPYQRDFVWTDEDRERLVESVFDNVEIGKFVYVKLPFKGVDSPEYEILDGKQRLSALVDFYLNKFPCRGRFFNELSANDRRWFRNFGVSVADCREEMSEEQKLRYFLMLNVSGHVMKEKHLNKVRKMLEEASSRKN